MAQMNTRVNACGHGRTLQDVSYVDHRVKPMGWEVHDGVLGGSSFFSQARIPVFSPVRGVSFHMELCRESQTGGGELLPCCDPVELEFPMNNFEQIAERERQFLL